MVKLVRDLLYCGLPVWLIEQISSVRSFLLSTETLFDFYRALFIIKLHRCNRWSLGIDKSFQPTLFTDVITNSCRVRICHQTTKKNIFVVVDDDCEFIAETKSSSAAALSPIPVVCTELHDDVIKWKHFPHYWSFGRGIHRSPHKGQSLRALMFSLICACLNDWVNNRKAGGLRRHITHYDVTVMGNCVTTRWGYGCFVMFIIIQHLGGLASSCKCRHY